MEIKGRTWTRDVVIAAVGTIVGTSACMLVDGFEYLYAVSRSHEHWNLDEVFLGVGILALWSVWFAWRRQQEARQHLSARVALEHDLRKSHDELSFLISAAPGVLYACESEDDFAATFMSPSAKAQLGYDPSDFMNDPKFWEDRIHPEDKERAVAEWRTLFERCHYVNEYRFRHADGSYRWMHDQLILFRDSNGKPERIVGFWYDITDRKDFEQHLIAAVNERTAELSQMNEALQKEINTRKSTEEERSKAEATNLRLARIVEDSINEIYVFDAKTLKFLEVNSAAIKNLGYTMEELTELTPLDLKPAYTPETFDHLIAPLRSGKTDHVRFETIHRRKDGSNYSVDVVLQQIRSDEQPVFAAIIEDITNRKLVEEQLHQAQKMDSLGQLTGGIAHDFNNMLTAIMLNLEFLRGHLGDDDRAKKRLDVTMTAAERAVALTQRLLAFARQQHLEPEVVDVRKVLSGMRGLLQTTVTEAIELKMPIPKDLRPIWADTTQLENAILNLVINARDAMPEGGRVTIESTNADLDETCAAQHPGVAPGSYVLLAVSDTGIGIPPELKARVFEPFFTTKEVDKGSGLGLSIIYGFVKQLGGHVAVYSEKGHGTSIKLYLPVAPASLPVASETSGFKDSYLGGGETILVVEDDAEVRETVSVLLEELGYRVLVAENAQAAQKLLKKRRHVDLLFTDVVMPGGMSGLDLAHEVSGRFPKLKLLCTSGYAEKVPTEDSKTNQRIAWIGKPYAKRALAQKIRQVLCRPSGLVGQNGVNQ